MDQLMFSSLYSPSQEDLLYAHRHLKIEINKFCPSGFPSLQTKLLIIIKCHFFCLYWQALNAPTALLGWKAFLKDSDVLDIV